MTNTAISDPLKNKGSKTESTPAKEKNYTAEQEEYLRTEYPKSPNRATVDRIAKEIGKGSRSVIAKLSNMKIYVTPERTTKMGTPIVKKETLVSKIQAHLDIEVPSLIKANKQDLEKILQSLDEYFGELED